MTFHAKTQTPKIFQFNIKTIGDKSCCHQIDLQEEMRNIENVLLMLLRKGGSSGDSAWLACNHIIKSSIKQD